MVAPPCTPRQPTPWRHYRTAVLTKNKWRGPTMNHITNHNSIRRENDLTNHDTRQVCRLIFGIRCDERRQIGVQRTHSTNNVWLTVGLAHAVAHQSESSLILVCPILDKLDKVDKLRITQDCYHHKVLLKWTIDRVKESEQQQKGALDDIQGSSTISTHHPSQRNQLCCHQKVAVRHILGVLMLLAPTFTTPWFCIATVAASSAWAVIPLEMVSLDDYPFADVPHDFLTQNILRKDN